MSHLKLALSALLLELTAWFQLASAGTDDALLLAYVGAHAGASALLGAAIWLILPARLRQPRIPVWLLLFGVGFGIPVLGFLALIVGLVSLPLLPAFKDPTRFAAVRLPELDPHERHTLGTFRQAGVRQFLNNPRAPVQQRLRALVALQNAPTHVASPMLRDLLTDGTEDLRLLAYGMLDGHEKRLNAAIHAERGRLAAARDEAARATAARRLSGLYWELIYQGLAQGDLRTHAARESLGFTEQALTLGGADAGLLLRKGRLLHALGSLADADAAYAAAHAAGLPDTRVLPYRAEVAFEQRDFARVRRLLAPLAHWPGLARLQQVVNLWRSA